MPEHYVLDTGFFVVSRTYYPGTFPSFWKKLNNAASMGIISSVDEVKKEIESYGGEQDHLLRWMKLNKYIFTEPSAKEQDYIRQIFLKADFSELIGKRDFLKNKPSADPFVIAKARVAKNGIVVTKELPAKKDKKGNRQGAPKIPDICAHFEVQCITPQRFMEKQKWRF